MPKVTRAQLKWNSEYYTPNELKSFSERDLRAEYSRLRRIANKRLKAFEGTEFEQSQAYRQNVNKYKPTSTELTPTQLRYKLTDLARFIEAETGSITGQRRQRARFIETMRDRGYTQVNRKNYFEFVDFMEEFKSRAISRFYDSERVAELFEIAERKKIDPNVIYNDFEQWLDKKEELEEIKPKRGEKADSEYYRKALGIGDNNANYPYNKT